MSTHTYTQGIWSRGEEWQGGERKRVREQKRERERRCVNTAGTTHLILLLEWRTGWGSHSWWGIRAKNLCRPVVKNSTDEEDYCISNVERGLPHHFSSVLCWKMVVLSSTTVSEPGKSGITCLFSFPHVIAKVFRKNHHLSCIMFARSI